MKELPLTEPPSIVQSAADLSSLLAAATAEHEAGRRAERASLEHYRNAGVALLKAKEQAGHGNWLATLKKTGISNQAASQYVRLARGWDKLPSDGNFTLNGALHFLTEDDGQAAAPRGDALPLHPLSMEYPPMTDKEFEGLKKSLLRSGFCPMWPIVLYQGQILDGKERYRACRELGIEPVFVELGADKDPEAFVIMANELRYHRP
jgi:hypothetical protein